VNPFVFDSSPKVAVPFIAGRSHPAIADARKIYAHSQSHSLETKVRESVVRIFAMRPFVFAFNERKERYFTQCKKPHRLWETIYCKRADSCIVMINFTSINSLMVVWNKINIACRSVAGCGEIPTQRALLISHGFHLAKTTVP
jgi:hypothetical protein